MWLILIFATVLAVDIGQSHSIPKKKHSTVTITEIEETEEDKWYEEKRGYASVRPDAHLFWWMYNKPDGGRHRPLLLWLQVSELYICIN